MKVRIELTETEIQRAIEVAIKDKFPDLHFWSHNIKLDGVFSYKKRSVRKPLRKIKAFVEAEK